jgi:MinD-like ATPase involved in chromosome partitioning or flagellar assembly
MLARMNSELEGLSQRMAQLGGEPSADGDEAAEPANGDDRALPAASAEAERLERERAATEAADVEREAAEATEREQAEAAERERAAQAEQEAAEREAADREQAEAAERERAAQAEQEAADREASEREAAEAAERERAAQAEHDAADAAERDAADASRDFVPLDVDEGHFGELEDLPEAPSSVRLPPGSPFADEEEAPLPPSAASEEINDYRPSYADLDEEGGDGGLAPVPAYTEREERAFSVPPEQTAGTTEHQPRDLLWAIAVVDPEGEATMRSQQAFGEARRVAAQDTGRGKKVKLEPLPFDELVAGTPLIAAIYSPSGGVGKTSTAMNLAGYVAAIAGAMAKKRTEQGEQNVRTPKVLLLDGDIVQGSLGLRLKNKVTPSIHTLQLYLDQRQEQGFQGQDRWPAAYQDAPPGEMAMRDFMMWPDIMPNFNLLAAPDEPDMFYDFSPADYQELLRLLSHFYDIIIIDCGIEVVMESNRAWLKHANEVFLITAPEIDRIYNASKAARYIATSRPHPQDVSEDPKKLPPLVTADRLSVIMNRYDMDSGLDPEKLMDESFPWLKDRPDQSFRIIDVDKSLTKANNVGRFLVLEHPGYAREIGKMAKHMFARYLQQRQRSLGSSSGS